MRLFVGNLIFTATEQDVTQLFEPFGRVTGVRLSTDRATGRARGFGFVDMPDQAEAQAAIEDLHGALFGGRPLTVNEARPRDARQRAGMSGNEEHAGHND